MFGTSKYVSKRDFNKIEGLHCSGSLSKLKIQKSATNYERKREIRYVDITSNVDLPESY